LLILDRSLAGKQKRVISGYRRLASTDRPLDLGAQ
jgi:hypothetical protein